MFPASLCSRMSLLMCMFLFMWSGSRPLSAQNASDTRATLPAAAADSHVAVSYQSVLEMLRSKADEEQILNRLQTSPILFTLSDAQVNELKTAGASDKLITAMQQGEKLRAAVAVEKPYYNAMNGAINATYTLTVYDDDQVQVAQKSLVVPLNPPDAQVVSIDWTVPIDGNAYVTIACQNSGQEIYPFGFDPRPGHVALQVTNGKPAE